MIKLIICGVAGRMGKRIAFFAKESGVIDIVGGVEKTGSEDIGKDLGEVCGMGNSGVTIVDNLKDIVAGCDLVVDFTAPHVSIVNARICKEAGKAIVIGTTGIIEEELEIFKQIAKSIPVLVSPNTSVGVNLLFNIAATVARVLGDDADIEIIEAHHRFKKDAPSGTAVKLAEVIAKAVDRDLKEHAVYGRQGIVGERSRKEIGLHAVRGGDIVGEHTVYFTTLGERIELTHRAHNRDLLAKGAIKCITFLGTKKEPGYYTMNDVLGF